MALTSSEEDVVNVAKTGLEHFLQQNKIPRDVLQVSFYGLVRGSERPMVEQVAQECWGVRSNVCL